MKLTVLFGIAALVIIIEWFVFTNTDMMKFNHGFLPLVFYIVNIFLGYYIKYRMKN